VTELNGGENQIPYGSCIFEAHVMTTLQENYYKWLFLLLSDIDEVKDEPFESRFKMEYECEDDELPVELIDYQEANNRLDGSVEIYFDSNEADKQRLFKVTTEREEVDKSRQQQREDLEELIKSVRGTHQTMIETMKERVTYIREIKKGSRLSDDDIKKLVSVEKKRLIQFRTDSNKDHDGSSPPENKKRRIQNDHKSRCSDQKVQFFQQTKLKLDKEESEGLIASWERIYKYLMNKIVKESICEVEPVMKEPSKMLNELGKAVDLDEIMNEDQNLQNRHNEWRSRTTT
jgi:acylphosphatase